MASNLPASLKSADVGRFALRAAQLENAKPIIAYWCNFWIVNQIIERGLHNSDDEVKLYTVNLMEKLEQFKTENPDNDAVLDSMAASAYVEQFGLEVFGRAEAAMSANKVTRQTADTFQAAATFLELCQIWNPLDPELTSKIKFAKYHALRIVKAIKAGEDPNATNPVIAEKEETEDITQESPTVDLSKQPSVEEVVDETENQQTSDPAPTLPQPPTHFTDISAASPNSAPAFDRSMDVDDSPLNLPSAPGGFSSAPTLPDTPTDIGRHRHSAPSPPPGAFQSFPPPSSSPPTSHDPKSFYSPPSATTPPPPPHFTQHSPAPAPVASYHTQQPAPASPPVSIPASSSQVNSHDVDDQAISLAQKHARWAVSALAFDDVTTAIKELKNSLRYLGAE